MEDPEKKVKKTSKVKEKKTERKTAPVKSTTTEKQVKKAKVANKQKENKLENDKVSTKNDNEKKIIIEISVGSIIAVIIIGILIVLNLKLAKHAYNVTNKNKLNSPQNQTEEVNLDIEENQEFGTVLNNKNEKVVKLIEMITLPSNVTASIYKEGTFDKTTIANDVKLRIGWAKIKDENKLRAKREENESIIAAEEHIMKESIQKIFGTDIEYVNESFDNTNVKSFIGSSQNQGIIEFSNNVYTGKVNSTEEKTPLIYQEIQKVVEYEGRIVIDVKTAFIDVKEDKYILYKEHNEDFNNVLLEVSKEELFGDTLPNKNTGEGTVTIKSNENTIMSKIRDKLSTNTYTFTMDNTTNEYCLSGFNI